MKLKRRDLNRLIENLLLEYDPGFGDDMGVDREGKMTGGSQTINDLIDDDMLAKYNLETLKMIDPSGLLSIPDLPIAFEEYEKDSSLTNAVLLILAVIAVIPIAKYFGKIGIKTLKGVLKALEGAKKVVPSNMNSMADDSIKAIKKSIAEKERAAMFDKMDPREVDDYIVNSQEAAKGATGAKAVKAAKGGHKYLDQLPADEIQDKLNALPISVKEYMDVRLTKTSTMNSVSKSGNRIFNDTVPLQATAFEDMMNAYGNIPNKGKVNVGFKPLPAGSPAGSVRFADTKPGFNLAPGDQVMVADGRYVHHEIVGITTDGERFGLLLKGGSKAGDNAGKNIFVSDETASKILSRYPGLVDEIVAKIIE